MAEYFLDLNRERTMEGLKVALARGRKGRPRTKLSKDDKKAARAMHALMRAGCEKIFKGKKPGKAGTKRPEFNAALAYLRSEEVLVVWKLDRLSRSPLR